MAKSGSKVKYIHEVVHIASKNITCEDDERIRLLQTWFWCKPRSHLQISHFSWCCTSISIFVTPLQRPALFCRCH